MQTFWYLPLSPIVLLTHPLPLCCLRPFKRMVEVFKKWSVFRVLCREECNTGIPQPGIYLDYFYKLSKPIFLLPFSPVILSFISCLLFYSLLLSFKNVLPDTRGCTPTVPSNCPLPFVFTVMGFLVSVCCYTMLHFYSRILGSSPYTEQLLVIITY